MVFDDKGGEKESKDCMTNGKGSIKILKHTSRGSKLINKLLHLVVH
jgi:hypothetical protein